MIAHLLGNGPSRSQFINEPFGDIYGCNLSDFSLPLKATFIMDKLVVTKIANEKIMIPWPMIMPRVQSKFLKAWKDCPLTVAHTFERNLAGGESTGHRGFTYLVDQGYKEIHLWGFDSIKKDTVASDSHVKIPEGPFTERNIPKWRNRWKMLLNEPRAKNLKVVVHHPEE